MPVNGNPPAVVRNGDTIVRVNDDLDVVTRSGHGFVYALLHHFVHQMMETAFASTANVHARPLAPRLQALQDLDTASVVWSLRQRFYSPLRAFRLYFFHLSCRPQKSLPHFKNPVLSRAFGPQGSFAKARSKNLALVKRFQEPRCVSRSATIQLRLNLIHEDNRTIAGLPAQGDLNNQQEDGSQPSLSPGTTGLQIRPMIQKANTVPMGSDERRAVALLLRTGADQASRQLGLDLRSWSLDSPTLPIGGIRNLHSDPRPISSRGERDPVLNLCSPRPPSKDYAGTQRS